MSTSVFTPYDRATSPEELRRKIYNLLENTTQQSFSLEQSWTLLGVMLAGFKSQECWRPLGYETFDTFMDELKTRFKRGRTQLYGYLAVAEKLLPTIGAEKLEQMGISKALELKRALKRLEGKPLPQALLDAALDPAKSTSELRGDISKALNITEDQKGTWFDLQGFFMTPEERAEFKQAFLATEALLQLKTDLPDHIRRKEVILTWMREWWGTNAVEYNGGKMPENKQAVLIAPTQAAHCIPAHCLPPDDPNYQPLQGESREEFERDRFGTAGPILDSEGYVR